MADDLRDTLTGLPERSVDHYTASIELSNACRDFYNSRVEATANFKKNVCSGQSKRCGSQRKTSIDNAMETLRNEMASLMDQDLSLMKQLLTLNEAIEDLKTKRLYHVSKDSLRVSSQDLIVSDWSVSETDMFTSEEELVKKVNSTTTSLPVSITSSRETTFEVSSSDINRKCDLTLMVNGVPVKVCHGQQSSLDSGYGDEEHRRFTKVYTGPTEVTI